MQINTKAFTLVEMLVTMAVSTIIIAATYASYDLVAKQYKKNLDIAEMHTTGRAIMQIIERDIRMAGFEYRDKDAKVTYGAISSPLVIKDSGNKCCDEITVVYDYVQDNLDWKGRIVSTKVDRIRIRYWTETYTSNKGSRHRLYKQKDILGKNNAILAKPIIGSKEVMADYIEDLQISDANSSSGGSSDYIKIDKNGNELVDSAKNWSCVKVKKTGLIWEVKTKDNGIHNMYKKYRWGGITSTGKGGKRYSDWDVLINESNNNSFCGLGNWRAPSKDELERLADRSKAYKPGRDPTINTKYFPNTLYTVYWSGSDVYDEASPWYLTRAYHISFEHSYHGNNPRNFSEPLRIVSKVKTKTVTVKLVDINLILRTRNEYGKDRQFKKKDYHGGNFKIDKTDKYKRDTFSSKVLVRNLAL